MAEYLFPDQRGAAREMRKRRPVKAPVRAAIIADEHADGRSKKVDGSAREKSNGRRYPRTRKFRCHCASVVRASVWIIS